jgi:hypothetical protein
MRLRTSKVAAEMLLRCGKKVEMFMADAKILSRRSQMTKEYPRQIRGHHVLHRRRSAGSSGREVHGAILKCVNVS